MKRLEVVSVSIGVVGVGVGVEIYLFDGGIRLGSVTLTLYCTVRKWRGGGLGTNLGNGTARRSSTPTW